jgi:hypothetical protein
MKTEIDQFSPCREALEFRRQYPTFEQAWKECPRGDWMLWIAKRLKIDNRKLTLAKGFCANTVIHLMKDQKSKDAVKAAIDYGNNQIDEDQLKTAADAAAAAYAADAAAAIAAYAAAYAAAATTAADAAAAYAAAAAAAYAATAKKQNQMITANICRNILTEVVMEKIKRLTDED